MAPIENGKKIIDLFKQHCFQTRPETVFQFKEQILLGKDLRLPCDIRISNNGYRIEKIGPSLEEDNGRRIFVIGTKDLEEFYRKDDCLPEDLYQFLRNYEIEGKRLGKYLALYDGPIDIDPKKVPSYKIIVKLVEHETDDRWCTFDLARFSFSPEKGLTAEFVERLIYWYGDRPLNLGRAVRDAPLHIIEPYRMTLRQRDIDFYEDLYKDLEEEDRRKILQNIFDRYDHKNKMFAPQTNTLIIDPLRLNMRADYGPPVPPLNAYIFQRDGLFFVRINHTENDLKRKTYGVDCVNVDGKNYFLSDQSFIEIPFLKTNKNNCLSLYYNGGSSFRRLGLRIDIRTDENNDIWADYMSGIESISVEQFNPSAGIISSLSNERLSQMKEEEEIEKKRRKEQKQEEKRRNIGTNSILFE